MRNDPDAHAAQNDDADAAVMETTAPLDLFEVLRETETVAEQLATWRAFAAPLAANAGAVVDDPELVRLAVAVLAVYADHQSRSGLSFTQLRTELRRRMPRLPAVVVDARLEHLHRMGFLEPYLPKTHQGRYVVRPAGLVGALATDRLTERGGVDELILLLDRTLSALNARDPDPDKVLTHFTSCRHALMVFGLDLERRVASGTVAELIEAGRLHDHSGFTNQVVRLNEVVTARFAGRHELEEAGASLIEAEQFYRVQVRAAIAKVLAHGGVGLNFDVLTPAEYEAAAVKADLDRLSEVGAGLIADAPGVHVDAELLVEAVESYESRSRLRVRPAETVGYPDDPDPLAVLEAVQEEARRHRRLGLEAQLGTAGEADLTPAMQGSWASAIDFLVGGLALDADPEEPFVLDLAEVLLVDPRAPVTYLHPARLVRTDIPLPPDATTTTNLTRESDER